MTKGSKNKSKKDKKGPKPPRPKALRKQHEELARIMFQEDDELCASVYVQDNTALLVNPYGGMNNIIYGEPHNNDMVPSTSQAPILFRAVPLHNQSGRLVLRGYFNDDDALCFQSMYPTNDEQLILWFFQYLAFKDLNSNFNWMVSCLVPKYGDS